MEHFLSEWYEVNKWKRHARFERRRRRLEDWALFERSKTERKKCEVRAARSDAKIEHNSDLNERSEWKEELCEGWDSNPWTTYRPDLKSGAVGLAWLPSPNYLITLYLQDIKLRGWHLPKAPGNAAENHLSWIGAGRRITEFKNPEILKTGETRTEKKRNESGLGLKAPRPIGWTHGVSDRFVRDIWITILFQY